MWSTKRLTCPNIVIISGLLAHDRLSIRRSGIALLKNDSCLGADRSQQLFLPLYITTWRGDFDHGKTRC